MTQISHQSLSNAIRFLAIDAVEKAKSGHPGMPMGTADIATVLFKDFLNFDPTCPDWVNRDRFILSAGHGSMLLYALLHLTGYEDFSLEEIKNFRSLDSRTAGHPEYGHGRGIETTTGPLGQGLATAVGIALGEKMAHARFGDAINHYTYVIASDGDLMEGVSHEAIGLAGHLKLNKLIVLFDDNDITIDGSIGNSFTGCNLKRFEASGWNAFRIDGHNPQAIHDAIATAKTSDKPTLIACKTIIGKGSPNKQNSAGVHGSPLGTDETKLVRQGFDWNYAPFDIPQDICDAWLEIGKKGKETRASWLKDYADTINIIENFMKADIPQSVYDAVNDYKKNISTNKPNLATRIASQQALEVINPLFENMIGGSADLTGSNNTKTKGLNSLTGQDYSGRYIHYGIREHGMVACMNGLALYGGFVPYGGTFLVFADYSRPALRLSALMNIRTIHVLTHDSIGLGEDGPTHQPVEHLASLRAIPNMLVFRPADAVETAEAWLCAMEQTTSPSVLALTRQGLATLRLEHTEDNLVARGGYILREAVGDHQITLFATGSEVEIAVKAYNKLTEEGIGVRVISMPSMELFDRQPKQYRDDIMSGKIRIAVEAAGKMPWHRFISDEDAFVGMNSFGASAPYEKLYEKFGITVENIVEKVKERI